VFPPSVLWHLSAIIWRRFLAQSRTTRVARSLSTNGWWWLISGSISISVSIACDPNYIQSERASFGTLRVYLLLTAVINARRKRVWHPLSALSAHENWTNVHCAAEKSVEHVGKWLKLKISSGFFVIEFRFSEVGRIDLQNRSVWMDRGSALCWP